MSRIVWAAAVVATFSVAVAIGGRARADEPAGRDIPPAFAPLEYLVGQWKGQAMPKDSAQSFRGWPETHTWAWVFTKGQPSAMTIAIRGGKALADGKLTFDPARKRYRLDGKSATPGGGPLTFEGALDASGKTLTLDQVGTGRRESSGTIRLSFRPNANFIRYTMGIDLKEPGAFRFHRATEVGLTKEGESLAGGATASDRPKCIVTGGAATMTLSYQGQSFPICCSGCRDEFNDNPEKYIKKASLMAASRGQSKPGQSAPAQVSRFEDAFAGDVDEAPARKPAARAMKVAPAKAAAREDSSAVEDKSPTAKKPAAKSSPSATRAASLLRIARNLEKSGKTRAALDDYKRILKDFAETPSAKTARERIKALEKP